MSKMTWEVYEDNGGGLYMVILKDGNLVRIFENWEYGPKGVLVDAVKQLADEPTAYEGWDGDIADDYDTDTWVPGETVKNLYCELTDIQRCNTLIADNDGIYFARMGAAGHRAFGA